MADDFWQIDLPVLVVLTCTYFENRDLWHLSKDEENQTKRFLQACQALS